MLRAPGRNADAVAELTIALLFAANRFIVPGRPRRARRRGVRATARSPTSATAPGSSPGAPPASSASARSAAPRSGASRASACACSSYDPYNPDATHHTPTSSTRCSPSATSCRCTRWSRPRPSGLIGAAQFAAMKPGSIYVNSARALLHDTDALVGVAAVGPPRRRRPRPLRGRAPRPPTIRCAR